MSACLVASYTSFSSFSPVYADNIGEGSYMESEDGFADSITVKNGYQAHGTKKLQCTLVYAAWAW